MALVCSFTGEQIVGSVNMDDGLDAILQSALQDNNWKAPQKWGRRLDFKKGNKIYFPEGIVTKVTEVKITGFWMLCV